MDYFIPAKTYHLNFGVFATLGSESGTIILSGANNSTRQNDNRQGNIVFN